MKIERPSKHQIYLQGSLWMPTILLVVFNSPKLVPIPLLYYPFLFLLISWFWLVSELYVDRNFKSTSSESPQTVKISPPSSSKSDWTTTLVLRIWPNEIDEQEQQSILSQQRGLISLNFFSRLGFATFYLRFPSHKQPWIQSTFWCCSAFLRALTNNVTVIEWMGGIGTWFIICSILFSSVEVMNAIDVVLSGSTR